LSLPYGYPDDPAPGPPVLVLFDGLERGAGSVEITIHRDATAAKKYLAGRPAHWRSQGRPVGRLGRVKNLVYEFGV
jgi:hypothetical protein